MIDHRVRRRVAVLAGLVGAGALLTTSAADVSARPAIVLDQSAADAAPAASDSQPVHLPLSPASKFKPDSSNTTEARAANLFMLSPWMKVGGLRITDLNL